MITGDRRYQAGMSLGAALLALLLVLTTCNAAPAEEAPLLGPLVQVSSRGTLRLVWWTAQEGKAQVRLETASPIVVDARSQAWQVDAPPPLDQAWQHVAELPDLPSGEVIPYYLLQNGVYLNSSRPYTLRVPPAEPPLRIAVIGDFGAGTQWEQDVHDVIASYMPDLILTVGDNAYDSGRYSEFIKRVFAVYGDLMSQIPFMPAIGNHDNYTDNAQPYLDFFVLPENAWREQDRERYYSFDLAGVHFVILDSTNGLALVSTRSQDDMADWLAADLQATTNPWRLAFFHHPPYSAGAHGSDLRARRYLVPVLEGGGVQFVFNGHEHDYQRTCPIRNDACVPPVDGITYVITGGGGAWLRKTGSDWFTARAASVHQVAFLTLGRCEAVLDVRDRTGQPVDRFTLNRCRTALIPWLTYHSRVVIE